MSPLYDATRPTAPDDRSCPADDDREATRLRPTVDEMSEWSFPASDPPATWTWEPSGS